MPAEVDPALTVSRRRLLQGTAVAVGLAVLGGAGGTLVARRTDKAPWGPRGDAKPVFGMLQAGPEDYADLREAGVSAVTLSVAWSRAQPEPGRLDEEYLRTVVRAHRSAREQGLDLALSPGLQYPPGWAAELPDARFVDQGGASWRGGAGDGVVDGVFNEQIRTAQGSYLRALGARLDGLELAGVRVGGLARGELHYPPVDRSGTRDTLWAYSRSAQARCPVPGWRPGSGTQDDARAFADWYLDALRDYALWQLDVLGDHLGRGPRRIVLLPSWGLRPGELDEAVASRLDGSTSGQRRGTLTEGLDWERQLRTFADQVDVDVCTTWLDPDDQGEDARSASPGRFLSALAATQGLRVWGENTGGNDAGDLRLCVDRVRELGLAGLFWMGAAQLDEGGNASLEDYATAIRR